MTKETLCTALGAVGGFVAQIMGGWDSSIKFLIGFMAVDYITGLIVAGVFHKSTKTSNGALESRAGWMGLCRKFVTLAIVFVANGFDTLIGSSFIRDAVVIGFIVNESLSIVENAGLMGLPIPDAITNGIEILKKKSEGGGNT